AVERTGTQKAALGKAALRHARRRRTRPHCGRRRRDPASMTLGDIRRDYAGEPLDEANAHADPFPQFSTWFEQARATEQDPTAMALATASRDGRPSVRTVLL